MGTQLFALPYAGGSASIYRDWASELGPDVSIVPIEYAGHASRFCEDYFKSIEEAAEDICETIQKQRCEDYIIYGHSMGCFVALETAYLLEKKKAVLPKAVIFAATCPPHLNYKNTQLGHLSREDLMKEIVSRGQFEEEILECEELYEMISDIMYADIQMYSKYNYSFDERKLSVPVLSITGEDDDEALPDDMKEWQKYTSGPFSFHCFKGNHFFAFNENHEVMEFIRNYVKSVL